MRRFLPSLLAAAAGAAVLASPAAADRADLQSTVAITQGNGDSSHPVISQDRRYSTILAFESSATDLVAGDSNGLKDIFMIRRAGRADNNGSEWRQGSPELISKGLGGAPANGASWAAAIDGGFPEPGNHPTYPKCIGFLSDASNLVPGDTNGVTDAFVSRGPGGKIERVSLPGGKQSSVPATELSVSIDCTHVAYVAGGKLYVRYRNVLKPSQAKHMSAKQRAKAQRLRYISFNLPGTASGARFSTGQTDDLVVGADPGVYLIKDGVKHPKLVAPGGRNPTYNDVKCRVVAYETDAGGHTQVAWRFLGAAPTRFKRAAASVSCHALARSGEQIASKNQSGHVGNGDSTKPSIGNSGFYITFDSDASNLGVNSLGRTGDVNGRPDVYLYTAVRDLTLVQSVEDKALPLDGGGSNASTSWYANYIFFDTPVGGNAGLPLGLLPIPGTHNSPIQQIFMRYLGPV
ncbi:MAG: hypothetical protein QOJ07_36 [Thermoleophilaceae bacterium]|nr:hypothetical protein [Thermoleophilaceae bacterium]